jgi:hypothetical protein
VCDRRRGLLGAGHLNWGCLQAGKRSRRARRGRRSGGGSRCRLHHHLLLMLLHELLPVRQLLLVLLEISAPQLQRLAHLSWSVRILKELKSTLV